MTENPKVFISYSWGSAEHQQWVLDLATQLRESSVDAIIDMRECLSVCEPRNQRQTNFLNSFEVRS
jgi:hypothetical protein